MAPLQRVTTHVVQQLLQVLLQLAEVHAGNQALTRFGQAVPGQLGYLVVDEAEDPVGHGENILWGVVLDELRQPLLHLRCGLSETDKSQQSCCDREDEEMTKI